MQVKRMKSDGNARLGFLANQAEIKHAIQAIGFKVLAGIPERTS